MFIMELVENPRNQIPGIFQVDLQGGIASKLQANGWITVHPARDGEEPSCFWLFHPKGNPLLSIEIDIYETSDFNLVFLCEHAFRIAVEELQRKVWPEGLEHLKGTLNYISDRIAYSYMGEKKIETWPNILN